MNNWQHIAADAKEEMAILDEELNRVKSISLYELGPKLRPAAPRLSDPCESLCGASALSVAVRKQWRAAIRKRSRE